MPTEKNCIDWSGPLPECEVCNARDVQYDAKLPTMGWCFCCQECFALYHGKLGVGRGQMLVVKKKKEV